MSTKIPTQIMIFALLASPRRYWRVDTVSCLKVKICTRKVFLIFFGKKWVFVGRKHLFMIDYLLWFNLFDTTNEEKASTRSNLWKASFSFFFITCKHFFFSINLNSIVGRINRFSINLNCRTDKSGILSFKPNTVVILVKLLHFP